MIDDDNDESKSEAAIQELVKRITADANAPNATPKKRRFWQIHRITFVIVVAILGLTLPYTNRVATGIDRLEAICQLDGPRVAAVMTFIVYALLIFLFGWIVEWLMRLWEARVERRREARKP